MWLALLFACTCLYLLAMSLVNQIGPMPSNPRVRNQANQAIRALLAQHTLHSPMSIAELGSGWGGWAQALESEVSSLSNKPEIHAFENNLIPHLYHRLIKSLAQQTTHLYFKNFLSEPIAQHPIWICYLCPALMKKLEEKRDQIPQPPSLISICFALPNTRPAQVITCSDWSRTRIYIYST